MGWASGSGLFASVWEAVRDYVPVELRDERVEYLLWLFRQEDCDTLDECVCEEWPEVEQALERLRTKG